MSGIAVGAHVLALLLAFIQFSLVAVLAYRLYLLSRVCKSADPRRTNSYVVLKVLRACIFIMTALQCVRCIDPFSAQGIWPYVLTRILTFLVTVTIYFQYSATTYIVMDTLFLCALKRTPKSLAIIVSILPVCALVIGLAGLVMEFRSGQQWVTAVVNFYVVFSLGVNVGTYNVSGMWLIALLRKHIESSSEDISGSKSASPFAVVVAKTFRSLALLTAPSVAAMIMYMIIGLNNSNTQLIPTYNPQAIGWNSFVTIFVQLILGLLFTRVAWISKTALDAELVAKMVSSQSLPGTPGTKDDRQRSASRADLKEKVARLSQASKPRLEGSTVECVAVTVEEAPVLPAVETA